MTHNEATARCWAEISLDEICGNYLRARDLVPGAEIICVLKGNAYGMGAPAVCTALLDSGAKTFAVASGDEAEELLTACPRADVLVLGRVGEDQAKRLIRRGCILTLFSREQGEMLARAAAAAGRSARVHVKAETGLYRLGFSGPRAVGEIDDLNATGLFHMEGLFTHLALHDRESDEAQFARLDALRLALADRGIHFGCVHALDSIGMVRYPERKMDAVRIGAWLYGVTPNRCPFPEMCHPVAKLKARVAQLHDVPAGERIGYDDDHFLSRDSRIATITAGYLDGVPRLNNVGEVLIRGMRAPIAGLVCMDQLMVDVTDVPGVCAGDEVMFLGGDIGVNEYAGWGHLNRNEALGRFGRRVTRVYRWKGSEFFSNDILRLLEHGKA